MAKKIKTEQEEPLEKKLWKAADKLRKNMDAAEYKHVVLELIFLKYISDALEELYAKLKEGKGEFEGAFAKKFNTHPAIIIGRLQHDRLISYSIGREFIKPVDLS